VAAVAAAAMAAAAMAAVAMAVLRSRALSVAVDEAKR